MEKDPFDAIMEALQDEVIRMVKDDPQGHPKLLNRAEKREACHRLLRIAQRIADIDCE